MNEKKYRNLFEITELKLKDNEEELALMAQDLKQFVARSSSYDIVTFAPSKIGQMANLLNEIEALKGKIRMLHWIGEE